MTTQDIELIARRVAELVRPEEPYLDKAGIAYYLKVSTRTVELEMRDKGLPYVTLFGRSKFKASEVERWLVDSGRVPVGHSPDQSGPAERELPGPGHEE
jgi:hypothetical protein